MRRLYIILAKIADSEFHRYVIFFMNACSITGLIIATVVLSIQSLWGLLLIIPTLLATWSSIHYAEEASSLRRRIYHVDVLGDFIKKTQEVAKLKKTLASIQRMRNTLTL